MGVFRRFRWLSIEILRESRDGQISWFVESSTRVRSLGEQGPGSLLRLHCEEIDFRRFGRAFLDSTWVDSPCRLGYTTRDFPRPERGLPAELSKLSTGRVRKPSHFSQFTYLDLSRLVGGAASLSGRRVSEGSVQGWTSGASRTASSWIAPRRAPVSPSGGRAGVWRASRRSGLRFCAA